ncbi:anti-sigma-W factor RsiW [Thermaerobacillus caldiproteolyticus]|uniref:Anti-sigma-W factor RsiW n=1 Tax=Thermaerobacillus caldiproteolyticus TaxID=247480 RepID=A0A7V9Z901_9BACL|nr:anti-sigma-W factor RsiW [Anoxybacillus caldiproteolyticus]MBA2876272.1 anti-sigma factor RsiW [Anoxybacillus caldiproteolyticus]QPA31101.1 anti-sigma-W factor RsiW [Anoxybacillus caldiproteolyticus]
MECPNHIIKLMHDYLDDDITPDDERELREHLQQCSACAHHFNSLKRTIAFIQHASHITPSSNFTANVMARLPKEKKMVRLGRWLKNHPFVTAASLFLALMVGSLFTTWNGEQQFSVSTRENVIIQDRTVIVPKGKVVEGDIVVRNGSIKIEGKVNGDVTVIHGEKYLASAGQVTGEIEEINQVFDWIWYNIKESVKDVMKAFE